MIATDEIPSTLPSALVDLRNIPLAEVPALNASLLGQAIGRVVPDPSENPVPVAAFQSAI
jgi:FXSXX-COOH protein